MKKASIALALITLTWVCAAQETSDMEDFVTTLASKNTLEQGSAIRTFDERYGGVKGHPFLFDDLKILKINRENKEGYSIYGNLDTQKNEFVFLTKSNVLRNFSGELIQSFSYDSPKGKANFIKVEGKFMERLFEGRNILLLKRYAKTLSTADYKGAYASGKNEDTYKLEEELYIQHGDSLHKIKQNIRSISKALTKNEKNMKQLAKNNELKISKEADLLVFLQLLDNLL